jgi:hypothetical protein
MQQNRRTGLNAATDTRHINTENTCVQFSFWQRCSEQLKLLWNCKRLRELLSSQLSYNVKWDLDRETGYLKGFPWFYSVLQFSTLNEPKWKLLTYSMVQHILQKADSHWTCQTTACFLYGTRRFITVLTKARHRIVSYWLDCTCPAKTHVPSAIAYVVPKIQWKSEALWNISWQVTFLRWWGF